MNIIIEIINKFLFCFYLRSTKDMSKVLTEGAFDERVPQPKQTSFNTLTKFVWSEIVSIFNEIQALRRSFEHKIHD